MFFLSLLLWLCFSLLISFVQRNIVGMRVTPLLLQETSWTLALRLLIPKTRRGYGILPSLVAHSYVQCDDIRTILFDATLSMNKQTNKQTYKKKVLHTKKTKILSAESKPSKRHNSGAEPPDSLTRALPFVICISSLLLTSPEPSSEPSSEPRTLTLLTSPEPEPEPEP